MKRVPGIFLLASLTIAGLFAQRGNTPATSTPTTGTNNSTTGLPNAESTNPSNRNTTPSTGVSTPIFISGRVAMADGSPIPVGLSIKRTCGVTTRTVAYTDSKGHFSFQSGQSQGVVQDAEDSTSGFPGGSSRSLGSLGANQGGGGGSFSANPLANCELKVDAPGFRSDALRLDDHRVLDNPDVGTIVLHRLANVEGTSVSATSLAAPSDAKKAYEKGLQAAAKGKTADAEKSFEKAVAVYPKYANAWLDLGRARLQSGQAEPAREAFLKALDADGKLVAADAELGMMAASDKNWKDAAEYLDATLRLDPIDYPQLWFPDAVAEFNTHKYDVAERSVREALKNDPQHKNPQADELLGFILLNKRDYAGGAEELRTYLKLAPAAADAEKVKSDLAQAENLQASASKPAPATPDAAGPVPH